MKLEKRTPGRERRENNAKVAKKYQKWFLLLCFLRSFRVFRDRLPESGYSMFCTCSRICSISTFMSTEICVISSTADLEPRVLASRCSS